MRYCKFCNKNHALNDKSHWVSNGQLKPACKLQRAEYRIKNRDVLNKKQNLRYNSNKRTTPTKLEKLTLIRSALKNREIELLTSSYLNNKMKLDLKCCTCSNLWSARWDNLLAGSECPQCAKITRVNTNIARYGVANPTQNSVIRLKAAKSANKIVEIKHWKTKDLIPCQGSYEVRVVNYFNKFKIDFMTQSSTFLLSDGSTYTPDFFIIDRSLFIEVKGYFYPDAKKKYDLFCSEYNLPIEIWDKLKLKKLEQ